MHSKRWHDLRINSFGFSVDKTNLRTLILFIFFFSNFRKKGFDVRSFGTGNQVKLPGPSPTSPNIYDFNTTYDEMYKDLLRKDAELYPFFS